MYTYVCGMLQASTMACSCVPGVFNTSQFVSVMSYCLSFIVPNVFILHTYSKPSRSGA